MEQMWKTIYLCEDSVEGIFTAVYDAWGNRRKQGTQEIRATQTGGHNYELFAEYVAVVSDAEKTEKVLRSVRKKLSAGLEYMLLKAAMSNSEERAQIIYEVLQWSFAKGRDCSNDLSVACNCRLMEILRYYGNEEHLMLGFLRFQPVGEHQWLAVMEPKNNILPGLMAHFSGRFNTENFIIFDKGRGIAGIYNSVQSTAHEPWALVELDDAQKSALERAEKRKDRYKNLWKIFFKTIAIEERENYTCQRNLCPLWYRTYMTEFLREDEDTDARETGREEVRELPTDTLINYITSASRQ